MFSNKQHSRNLFFLFDDNVCVLIKVCFPAPLRWWKTNPVWAWWQLGVTIQILPRWKPNCLHRCRGDTNSPKTIWFCAILRRSSLRFRMLSGGNYYWDVYPQFGCSFLLFWASLILGSRRKDFRKNPHLHFVSYRYHNWMTGSVSAGVWFDWIPKKEFNICHLCFSQIVKPLGDGRKREDEKSLLSFNSCYVLGVFFHSAIQAWVLHDTWWQKMDGGYLGLMYYQEQLTWFRATICSHDAERGFFFPL